VILVDANILLHATNSESDQHEKCRAWLDEKLGGAAPIGLPWPSLLAFLRIATNPRALRKPLNMAVAWQQVANWLSVDTVWMPAPTAASLARPLWQSRTGRASRRAGDRAWAHPVLDGWGLCPFFGSHLAQSANDVSAGFRCRGFAFSDNLLPNQGAVSIHVLRFLHHSLSYVGV